MTRVEGYFRGAPWRISFETIWSRKSSVGGVSPFDVARTPSEAKGEPLARVDNVPVFAVSGKLYDAMARTLDSFPRAFMKRIGLTTPDSFLPDKLLYGSEGYSGVDDEIARKKWQKATGGNYGTTVFVVKYGNKMLAIDTQGYSYPRYKGFVKIGKKVWKM